MKLTSDNETLAENRALILYVLNKVNNPINNDTLFKLVITGENINYFYFQQFLLDLIDSKYIVNYKIGNESVYKLTSEGKYALTLVEDLIPGIIKFNIDKNFKENLNSLENELAISADFIPNSETNYTVKCKILESSKVIFEIETFAGSREQAKAITDNWLKNADSIYPKILGILNTQQEN